MQREKSEKMQNSNERNTFPRVSLKPIEIEKHSINGYQSRNELIINSNNDNNFSNDPIKNKKDLIDKELCNQKKDIFQDNYLRNNMTINEINSLSYKDALIIDNRTYLQYSISLIKVNHTFIFSFFLNNDYNSKIIKIELFFFLFVISFGINALFFNDSTMHQIYEDKGSFNLAYQLPKIIYSNLISISINIIVKKSALTETNIIESKIKIKKVSLDEKEKKKEKLILKKIISIKIIIFYVIIFIFLVLFRMFLRSI